MGSKWMMVVVTLCVVMLSARESAAIYCPPLPSRPTTAQIAADSQCRTKQQACKAACRAVQSCIRGCTQDFELSPDEYLVEVIVSVPAMPPAVASPVPTATTTSWLGATEAAFASTQEAGRKVLVEALVSIGVGLSQSDAMIEVFDTTPVVFVVGNLSEALARELSKQRGIKSVSQMVKPQLVVSSGGILSSPSASGNALNAIHPMQLSLENYGGAQVQESTGRTYQARGNVDVDALSAWTKEPRMGEGIVIAAVDDGFNVTDPNLARNVVVNAAEYDCNGKDDDGNGYVDDRLGWNSVTKTGCGSDLRGQTEHGTNVAGIAAATARSSADQMTGAAPFAKFLPVKASESEKLQDDLTVSTFSSESLAEAYRFVLRRLEKGENIKVLNLSLSMPCEAVSPTEISVLRDLANEGVSIVVAAGNYGSDVDKTRFCPAVLDIPGLVSVANIAPNGELHISSNFGSKSITTAAPGTLIYGVNGRLLTGTSMAAPLVSGVVALMYAAQPLLSPTDVQDILIKSKKQQDGKTLAVKSGGWVSATVAVQRAREWKVFGTVVDDGTGRPLGGVLASLSSPSTGTVGVVTDSRGRFALPRPKNGEAVNLSFTKAGHDFFGNASNRNSDPREILEFQISGTRREATVPRRIGRYAEN